MAAVCCVVATGCGERAEPLAAPVPSFGTVGGPCLSVQAIEDLIGQVFPSGGDRSSALSRFRQVNRLLEDRRPGPDTASAQRHAISLVDFILRKYEAGQLIGGTSAATQATVESLLDGILCVAGLPGAFGAGSLGADGAVAFILPTTPDTTVTTGTLWAGVHVPNGSVGEASIVTITPLPRDANPLLTGFDQYPLFYEFHITPAAPFTQTVLVGVCQPPSLGLGSATELRLRLAHNVAPYGWGNVEIAPYAVATFLDCSTLAMAPTPFRRLLDLAVRVVSPSPLFAASMAVGGVGGTVRSFSPFGAVDTLGVLTAASRLEQREPAGTLLDEPPAVWLRTPTGQPIAGIAVTFATTAGDGVLTGGVAISDATGRAAATSWQLGSTNTEVTATVQAPPGTGFSGNGRKFWAFVIP